MALLTGVAAVTEGGGTLMMSPTRAVNCITDTNHFGSVIRKSIYEPPMLVSAIQVLSSQFERNMRFIKQQTYNISNRLKCKTICLNE